MKRLLDTHVLWWWMADDPRLSRAAREALSDRRLEVYWSVASTWEMAIKSSLGKLRLPEPVGPYLSSRLTQQGIDLLSIGQAHAVEVASLPLHHRDPFDRLLVAQARVEGLSVITGDPAFADYEVDVTW